MMMQLGTVRKYKAAIAQTHQAVPITAYETRHLHAQDRKVHALIRLMLRNFEQSPGIEAEEQFRQELVNLVRAELFSGDEIADFGNGQVPTCTRVAFLSESLALKSAMQRALPSNRYTLTPVCSTGLIEKAIDKGVCDVAIVDIERRDAWPGSVFTRFDEVAAGFPIVILCKKRREALSYLWRAQHAADIVSYETISDPRFLKLIDAAVFRAEITRDSGIGNDSNWTPSPADYGVMG